LTLLVIKEDTTSTIVEKDIAPAADVQQPTAIHNDLEEVSFAAQQAPISPVIIEDIAVSIPNAQVSTSPDALVPANQEIDVDVGKNIDEPITSVLAVAPSESLVDSNVSLPDVLLFYPSEELQSASQ
jgi:hypothetical protein